jgi:hypothetical protein
MRGQSLSILFLALSISQAAAQRHNPADFFEVTLQSDASQTILDGKVSISYHCNLFDHSTLSFDGIAGIADKCGGDFAETGIHIAKGQVFYIKIEPDVLYHCEVVQESHRVVTLEFSKLDQTWPSPSDAFFSSSWGVGFGLPYGVLGINVDGRLVENLHLSLGIGWTILSGGAGNFGLKYFLLPVENNFRPRLSLYYGINTIANENPYMGFSFGVGSQWMWGQTKSDGLDFDIIFILSSSFDTSGYTSKRFQFIKYGSPFKIAVGYRHGIL